MDIQLSNIWIAAGIILGFQVTWFIWRISREVKVGAVDLTWLPPADIVNLISMTITTISVFILPILGVTDINIVKRFFVLALLLFSGYPFALAGHYDMYNPRTRRSNLYFPFQERIAISVIGSLAIAYIVFAFM